jgi:hypothetical protein
VDSEQPLPVGAQVIVRRDPDYGPGPWPSEPRGVVSGRVSPYFTVVQTLQGPERTYWITFDEPQQDAEGDGPYDSSQVLERYLEIPTATDH